MSSCLCQLLRLEDVRTEVLRPLKFRQSSQRYQSRTVSGGVPKIKADWLAGYPHGQGQGSLAMLQLLSALSSTVGQGLLAPAIGLLYIARETPRLLGAQSVFEIAAGHILQEVVIGQAQETADNVWATRFGLQQVEDVMFMLDTFTAFDACMLESDLRRDLKHEACRAP